jgi:dihydrolipoamide dehydrogenase
VAFQKASSPPVRQVVKLPFVPEDPRIVDSTGALELRQVPKRMLVIGGGIIGLEMATVYSTLGARIDVVEMMDGLMQGADREAVKVWQKYNAHRFDNIMLKTKTVGVEALPEGIKVSFEVGRRRCRAGSRRPTTGAGGRGPQPERQEDRRRKAGVAVTDRGFIGVDGQMRTNVPHIFAIGDLVGQPMLAHKAVHEGHVAAEAAHGEKAYFDAKVIPVGGLHRSGSGMGRPDRRRSQGQGHQGREGPLPVGRLGPRRRQRPRRRLHQAAVDDSIPESSHQRPPHRHRRRTAWTSSAPTPAT